MNLAIVLGVEPEFVEVVAKSYRARGWRASVHYRPRATPEDVSFKTLVDVSVYIADCINPERIVLVCDNEDGSTLEALDKLTMALQPTPILVIPKLPPSISDIDGR